MNRADRRLLPLYILITAAVVCIGLTKWNTSVDPNPFHAVAVRFWHSIDNQIPSIFARALSDRELLRPVLFDGWQGSDRPPLVSGALLLLPSEQTFSLLAFVSLVAIGSLVVPTVWAVARIRGANQTVLIPFVVALVFGPGIFTNIIYTWPKMPAANLCLVSLGLTTFGSMQRTNSLWVGLALGAAVLSHGSATFFAIVFVGAQLFKFRAVIISHVLAAAAGLNLPWFAYQRYYDPPGNRLLYWHFAGQINPPYPDSLLVTVFDSYLQNGLVQSVLNKTTNIVSALIPIDVNPAISGYSGVLRPFNVWGQMTLIGASGLIGLLFPVSLIYGRMRGFRIREELTQVLFFTALFFAFVEFGSRPNSTASLHIAPLVIPILVALATLQRLASDALWRLIGTGAVTYCLVNYGLLFSSGEAAGWKGGGFNFGFTLAAVLSCGFLFFLLWLPSNPINSKRY